MKGAVDLLDEDTNEEKKETAHWNAKLSYQELEDFYLSVLRAQLQDQEDVDLSQEAAACTGLDDLEVIFVSKEGVENAFAISGDARCHSDLLSPELNRFFSQVKALQKKYGK